MASQRQELKCANSEKYSWKFKECKDAVEGKKESFKPK